MNRFRLVFDNAARQSPDEARLRRAAHPDARHRDGLDAVGLRRSRPRARPWLARRPPAEQPQVTRALPGAQASYADVVAEVAPAVVTVRSERVVRAEGRAGLQMPGDDDDFFSQFFGNPRGRRGPMAPREEGALGSGVIVSADGYILTNHHVIDGANQIKVDLTDRRTFDAKLVGSDAASDLAVLKIDASNLPVVRVGNSDRVRVGDVVLAVGNPLGVGQTVTMGIISAKGRATGLSDGSFEDFLQTDAPINQGNSGGALVNTRGRAGRNQLADPHAVRRQHRDRLRHPGGHGAERHAAADQERRRAPRDAGRHGAADDVGPGAQPRPERRARARWWRPSSRTARRRRPASQRGDVILDVNGTPVTDSNSLRNRVAGLAPGSRAALAILRDGKQETVHAVLAELPNRKMASNDREGESGQGRFGLAVEPVTPDVANQLGLKNVKGLVVSDVAPGSPASDAGVRPGDVIEQVNRKPVSSVSELQDALKASAERPALLLLNRQGNSLYVALAPRNS